MILTSMQSRAEFDDMLKERINVTYMSEQLPLASQAQFYFDALWAGALGLNKTLGRSVLD